jgi:hypothetical protein
VDTLRLLLEVDRQPLAIDGVRPARFGVELQGEAWVVDPLPAFGMVAVEGNPSDGRLWSPDDVLERGRRVYELVDVHFGVRAERGVSRLDVTTSRRFEPSEGRGFMAGVATLEMPRLEATRRGTPVHSVWWTGAKSATIKNRAYCESFKVAGREPFERIRLEDQRRFPSGHRPTLEAAADPARQRQLFQRRWEPMRKAVDGVKAASFPVVAQALADEVRYGFRPWREAERLAGALVLFTGGVKPARGQKTLYRRRAELKEAGFIVLDDFMEPVEVELADELDRALEEFGS